MLENWIKTYLTSKKNRNFQSVKSFKESTRALSNPGCGWYHLYSFDLSMESFLYIACEEEELVLLRIDIHAFRSCEQIPKEALDRADRILTYFSQHGKGIILRIVYDIDGHGMEHEPSSVAIVKSHMNQLGTIIKAHAGEILVHQGLFVGSWGEMHDSKFLAAGYMEELAATLAQAIEGTCPIAVRRPVQLRSLESKTIPGAFTLFNDGIFGSKTDLGTYGTVAGSDSKAQLGTTRQDEKQAWSRQDELDWQQTRLQRCFCGGEALGGMKSALDSTDTSNMNRLDLAATPFYGIDWQQAASELAKMHVSYLNSTYRQELLDDWKAQRAVWNGEEMSGYDYIGRHLGYRFTVIKASIIKEKKAQNNKTSRQLQITIRNTGFANLCEEAVCKLVLVKEDSNTVQYFEISCDPRTWDSGADTTIQYSILQEIFDSITGNQKRFVSSEISKRASKNTFKVYLQLTRKRDGRILAFANEECDRQFGVFLSSFDHF